MGALAAAVKLGKQAASVGFDWPDALSAFGKVEEEVGEVSLALDGGSAGGPGSVEAIHHEIGDLLFAAANLARKAGIDPESALRSALDRFIRRFRYIEERIDVAQSTLDAMEALWKEAKAHGL